MGWGIIVHGMKLKMNKERFFKKFVLKINGLYLNRYVKSDLNYKLEENLDTERRIRDQIIGLIVYSHHTYLDGENKVPIVEYATTIVPELLDELQRVYQDNMLIKRALEAIDEIEIDD